MLELHVSTLCFLLGTYIWTYIYVYIYIHFHQTHLWLIDCVVAAHVIIDMYPYTSLHHSLTLFIASFPPSFFIRSVIKYAFREESNESDPRFFCFWEKFPFKSCTVSTKKKAPPWKKQVGTMASSFSACFSWCLMPFSFGNWCPNVAEKKTRDISLLHLLGMAMKYLLLDLEKLDLNTVKRRVVPLEWGPLNNQPH